MLFLFLQSDALNIIENALAIEFIWDFDVDHAKLSYWDPKRRWIKAAVECRLRVSLEIHELNNPELLCRKYQITFEQYKEAFGTAFPEKQ